MKLIIFGLTSALILTIIFSFSVFAIFITAQSKPSYYLEEKQLENFKALKYRSDSPEGRTIPELNSLMLKDVRGNEASYECRFDDTPSGGWFSKTSLPTQIFPIGTTNILCQGKDSLTTELSLRITMLEPTITNQQHEPTSTNLFLIYILIVSIVGGIAVALFLKFRKRSTGSESDVIDVK